MNKLFLALFLGTLTLFSCDNNTVENGFEMSYIQDFTISAGLNTLETHVFEFDITSNFQNYLTQQGIAASDVQRIIPKYIRMSNINGNQTYDILSRVRFYVSKTDGTLEYETAFREPVPQDIKYDMDLVPTLVEVTDQLSESKFKIKLKLNFNQTPTQSIDTRLILTFQAVLL